MKEAVMQSNEEVRQAQQKTKAANEEVRAMRDILETVTQAGTQASKDLQSTIRERDIARMRHIDEVFKLEEELKRLRSENGRLGFELEK